MSFKRGDIKIAFLLVALIGLMAWGCRNNSQSAFECADEIGCVEIPPGASIRIGVLQALTGKTKTLGFEQIRGIELAVDALQGKLAGHAIVFVKEDTGCSAEGGANAALKMASDPQITAVIGTTCSVGATSAAKIISDAGMVMISGNNSAPFLTSIGGKRAPYWQNGYFRTAKNEEDAGKAAAIYAFTKLGAKKAAVVNDGDIYTKGLTDGFENQFKKVGGQIVLTATVNKGDEDMTPVLEAIKYMRADIIFFPLFQPEGNHILRQAKSMRGLENVILMTDGALIEATFIEDVRDSGKGMLFVGPAKPETAASTALERQYEAKFKSKPQTSYYLSAFDAANLLFNAIEKVAFKESDGSLHIGRQALRNEMYSTRNFKGVTGHLNCNEFGDCSSPQFNILRLDDPSQGLAGLESNIVYTYVRRDSQ